MGPFRRGQHRREVDFFSIHPFTIYTPDPFSRSHALGTRNLWRGLRDRPIRRCRASGHDPRDGRLDGAVFSRKLWRSYDRAMIYSGVGAGAIGIDLWCFTDAAPEQFLKVPYLRTPQETGWGMTTWDRQDKPLGTRIQKFFASSCEAGSDGTSPLLPRTPRFVIPDEWAKPHGDFSRFGSDGPRSDSICFYRQITMQCRASGSPTAARTAANCLARP